MLTAFRNFANSLPGKIFFGLLALCFIVLWGAGDYFMKQGNNAQIVANVGGKQITARAYQQAFLREAQNIQQRIGRRIDIKQLEQMGLPQYVLNEMVQKTMLDIEVENLGLEVPDIYVKNALMEDPSFHVEGEFNQERFQQVVRHLGFTEKTYSERVREELRRNSLLTALASTSSVSDEITKRVYTWRNEKRKIQSVTLTKADLPSAPAASEKELKNYYLKNEDSFKTPEKRTVDIAILNIERILPTIEISEAELQSGFERLKGDYKDMSSLKAYQKVSEKLKRDKAADALYELSTQIEDGLAGGATLEDIAASHGLKVEQLKDLTRDLKYKGDVKLPLHRIREIVKKAFSMKVKEDPIVIDANGQYIVVSLKEVQPSKLLDFKFVREKVRTDWAREKQAELLLNRVKETEKIVNEKGMTFHEAVKKVSKRPTTQTIDRTLPSNPDTITRLKTQKAFSLEKGKMAYFPTQDGGYLLFAVEEVIPYTFKTKPSDYGKFEKFMKAAYNEDIIQLYLLNLQQKYKVDVNQSLFNQS